MLNSGELFMPIRALVKDETFMMFSRSDGQAGLDFVNDMQGQRIDVPCDRCGRSAVHPQYLGELWPGECFLCRPCAEAGMVPAPSDRRA